MEPRISLITLGVADLARSYRFYREGLGLPTTRAPGDGIVFFQTSGTVLALFPYAELAADIGPGWDVPRSRFTGTTLAHNVRERHEVDDLLADAAAAGAEVVTPAQETEWAATTAISPTRTGMCGRWPGVLSASMTTDRCG